MIKKLQCNDIQFTLFVALLFTLVNSLFIQHCWRLIHPDSLRTTLFSLSIPIVLFCGWVIIFSLAALPWLRKPIIALLLLGSAASNYFLWSYSTIIDQNMIVNVFETTRQEAGALITPQFLITLMLTGVLPAVILTVIRIQHSRWWSTLLLRALACVASLTVIILMAAAFYKDYASLFRNHKDVVKMVTPPNYISAISKYAHARWFSGDIALIHQGEDARQIPRTTEEQKKNVVILVVGEASRAQNYGLEGYTRNTTPELEKQPIYWFHNATSCGTETAVSLPCLFSGMPRKQYDADVAHHKEGLLDVMAHAGINVLWRDNDGGCKGACDRIHHTDMTQWNLDKFCHDGICLDDALLYRLDAVLDGIRQDSIIVLHLMGSHGPAYYQRYPEKFRQFTPTCDTNQIQTCSQAALINTYDNSILYTDDVLNRTIYLLKQRPGLNTALVYFSDHGESLGENGIYLHGTPWILAPEQQTHIPFMFWLSEGYTRDHHIDSACLAKEALQTEISQDNVFSTLLGMLNIQTRVRVPEQDILAHCTLADRAH